MTLEHGLFCALYTDRGSHYFHTPKAGEQVSKSLQTQVGRALQQLGIPHIAAYSPEARGRLERAFRTLQERLPKELALAGIATVAAANRWLAETYPGLQRRLRGGAGRGRQRFRRDRTGRARNPVHPGGAPGRPRQHRQMAGLSLQIPPSPLRPHFVKATVRVHEYPDGASRSSTGRIAWPITTPTESWRR